MAHTTLGLRIVAASTQSGGFLPILAKNVCSEFRTNSMKRS